MFAKKKIEEFEEVVLDLMKLVHEQEARLDELEKRLAAKPVAEPKKEVEKREIRSGFPTEFMPKHTIHPNEDYRKE